MKTTTLLALALLPLAILTLSGCGDDSRRKVVLYCSLDEQHALGIVRDFERQTGIEVVFVPDNEQNKTVGLVNRLLQEKDAPQCDVYWNNEIAQTIRLKNQGVLTPFDVPSAASIPARWKDPQKTWYAFAARARVFIISRKLMAQEGIAERDWPHTMEDLANPRFKGLGCISRPITGTSATHGTALFSLLGADRARDLFERIAANGIIPMDSNGSTARAVREDRVHFGLTDSDDFHVALLETSPERIAISYVGGRPGDAGVVLIPNTVCKIKGGPHSKEADELLEWILSKEVEARLARASSRQIPLRAGVPGPTDIDWDPEAMHIREIDWEQVARDLDNEAYQRFMKGLFRR